MTSVITEFEGRRHQLSPQHPSAEVKIMTRPSLYGDQLYKGYVSLLTGAGGAGKSVFSLTMACSLAIGKDLLGLGEVKPRRVLILNNEDPQDEIERRLRAISVAYRFGDVEKNLVSENLWFQSGYHQRLQLAFENEGEVMPTVLQGGLITFCQDNSIDALFLDPLVSIHDCNENDNNSMNVVIQILREIAEEGCVGIYVAHHSRKGGSADTPDDNARGASAITAGVRANYGLSKMTEKEAGKFILAPDEWAHLIRLDSGKRNYSPNAANANWFELKNTPLDAIDWETGEPSTEWVGVPMMAKLESVEKDMQGWTLQRVMQVVVSSIESSPFTRIGTTGEKLKQALSDTKSPIGSSTLANRLDCFPAPHEAPAQVVVHDTKYKCWSEKDTSNKNRIQYHFEET